jgi:beta-barrel assembly-enhancing protease
MQKHAGVMIATRPARGPLRRACRERIRRDPLQPSPMPQPNRVHPPHPPSTARWRRVLAAGLAGALLFGAALPPTVAQVRLPALGESASDDLSVSAERRIGDQIMREGRRDPAYLDDPVLHDYLQQLWAPLVEAARAQGDIHAETDRAFAWEAFLVRDRSVNAFALPGGYVGVHLGLIALTNTPDQLASVLAHELTHVTQRHIARSIAPQQRASVVAVAALLLGILAASRSSNMDAANAAMATGQAAAVQGQLNFSRDMEREADRVGYGVLAAAGYNAGGMAAMFDKLDAATRLNDSGGFPYLRSHPLTVDRISEARNRNLLAGTPPPQPTVLHAVMQARARVLMDDSVQSLARLNGGTSSPLLADRVGALYGGALASSLLKDHARAQGLVAEARQLVATAVPAAPGAARALGLLQAQLQMARGDAAAALATLNELRAAGLDRGTRPGADRALHRPSVLLRAQALLDLQRQQPAREGLAPALRDSTETLQTWVAEHAQDAAAWELLAATSQVLDLRLRSMRAAAEARAVVGDLTGAIDRLRAAQQMSRGATGQDFIEGSVIDARLRQLVAQRRQLQLDAREARGGRGPEEPPPQ